jgi:hypothetical protein
MSTYQAMEDMAVRGRWLIEKLSERTTPDGRTVLELVDEPIWIRADGTLRDYIAAVDRAIAADDSFLTMEWDSPRAST